MISYLGVTLDELLKAFEDSLEFSDDRPDRSLELPIEVDEIEADADEILATAEAGEDFEDEEEEDEESHILVDEAGQLHVYGETVAFAAEEAIDFLTDYIITDDLDLDWLTLDQARGALLALRIVLPELEEIPEAHCKYSFTIQRSPETGYPNHIVMEALPADSGLKTELTIDAKQYKGVIEDSTSLVELFDKAQVAEDERELLADVLNEGVLTLSEEQCGLIIDIKGLVNRLQQAAAEHRAAGTSPAQH